MTLKTFAISAPQLGLIVGTRAMLGAGVGLLVAGRLSNDKRRAVGWTLAAVGAATTIPLVLELVQGSNGKASPEQPSLPASLQSHVGVSGP